jgi:hypothetical protein
VACDDHAIVVHGDLACVEVNGRPFEPADLAAATAIDRALVRL